ncbi:MAG: outer membrane beta-barrel protein [Gemmatimonadales bacterium]
MKRRITLAIAGLAISAATANAQPPRPLELGVDAGVTIGLGDNSVTVIDIPVQSARIGFPISPRTSIEPKFALQVITGNGDTFTSYRGELGLLYHLGSGRYPGAYHRAGMYVRPFVGVVGFSDGTSDTSGLLGAGVGFKMPLVSRLSSRFEANFAHVFGDNDFNEIGLLAGLSFFTR